MKNALAVLFGLAMAIVLAELGLRVVSRFHAPVRYLVTAGDASEQPVFPTLEAYLASRPDVVPHRDFLNYWANAFGLNDVEFVAPKPQGRFRIMALGDSFTYGLVSYPDAVMTRVEEALRARCSGMDLDLLNFGIGGTGVWDYKLLFELAGPTYDPDLVLVNLYLGNDGPDLFARPRSFRRVPSSLRKSYLARYVVNVVRIATGVDRHVVAEAVSPPQWSPPAHARGGEIVDAAAPLRPDDRQLTGPIYTEERFPEIMWDEYRRFARPSWAPSTERSWAPTLAILDLLRHEVARQGRRMTIALYPSVLQVYPEARHRLEERLRGRPDVTGRAPFDVDPLRPNRVVLEYCRSTGLACYDTTVDLVAAARQSAEPLYKALDTHWTVRGNHVVATAQARGLQPIVCPEARPSPPAAPPR
jgi:hypothetical protein